MSKSVSLQQSEVALVTAVAYRPDTGHQREWEAGGFPDIYSGRCVG